MSKKRIIAVLVLRRGIVVQSIGFARYLPVGRPEIAARFLSDWGIDEIVLVDIEASGQQRLISPEVVARVAEAVFVPLTVGGGIRDVDDVHALIKAGADKVVINRLAVDDGGKVSEAVRHFGSQCIVVSVDVRSVDGQYRVFADSGRRDTGLDVVSHARRIEQIGAGEILLNSIDRDGARNGYDLTLGDMVGGAVRIPVILQGGAGHPAHIADALAREGISAAAAANFLHYTEHSVATIKSFVRRQGIDLRSDSFAAYDGYRFDTDGRIAKQAEPDLARQIFEYFPEEVI